MNHNRVRPALLAVALALAVAFAQPMLVDGSSVEAYERSVRLMADSLSEADREVFGIGLLNVIISEYPPARGSHPMQQLQMSAAALAAAHVTLDGWTLEEIIARGRSVGAQGDGELRGDPSSLQGEMAACVARVVTVERAAIESDSFGFKNVLLEVRNGLAWPIAGIRVGYRALSEGRSVPWIETDFAITVSGGIEPGEVRQIRTSAFPPSDAPAELVVEATVLDVADVEMRLLVGDVRIAGWSDDLTPLACHVP